MHLSTLTVPPAGMEVAADYGLVFRMHAIEISDKGLIRSIAERDRNPYQEALDIFAAGAPTQANAIMGMQVTSSTQQMKEATYIYYTFTGTAVKLQDIE